VNHATRALELGGNTVTALHSPTLGEEPRLCFMHFWANDDALALARTLHAALQQTPIEARLPLGSLTSRACWHSTTIRR
jgi:hypothetical protein